MVVENIKDIRNLISIAEKNQMSDAGLNDAVFKDAHQSLKDKLKERTELGRKVKCLAIDRNRLVKRLSTPLNDEPERPYKLLSKIRNRHSKMFHHGPIDHPLLPVRRTR